jgi:hypothetical protein
MATNSTQPFAAIVTAVWNDRMINVAVFDSNGRLFPMTSVMLLQDDDQVPEDGVTRYCTWMPYQVERASKAEMDDEDLHDAVMSTMDNEEDLLDITRRLAALEAMWSDPVAKVAAPATTSFEEEEVTHA